MDETFTALRKINDSKGMEYADDSEALRNFYRRSEELGVDPMVVWGIFFGKHADSIMSYIKAGEVRSEESIHSRVHDALLYLILLLGLIEDRERGEA